MSITAALKTIAMAGLRESLFNYALISTFVRVAGIFNFYNMVYTNSKTGL